MCPYTLCPCENNTMGLWWVWVADPWWDHAQWKWIDGYWQKWHEICWRKATMGEAWWNSYWQTLRWHSTERKHNDIIAQKEKKIAKVSTLWIASLLHGPIRLGIRVVYLLYSKSYSGCKIDLCYDLAISLLDISFILLYGMIICPTVFCASNRKHMSQRRVASNASASCPLTSHQLIPMFACCLRIACHLSSVCLSSIAFSYFSCWAAASLTATLAWSRCDRCRNSSLPDISTIRLLQNRLLVVCRLEAEQTQHDQRKMHTKCVNDCKSVVPQDSRKGQMRINKGQQVPMANNYVI